MNDGLVDSMRQALRTFTKPCVLVTSCTDKDDITTYSGVTLSSFDAVTLDPVPHISFNIRVPSRTYDALKASNQICVHILSATTSGATIADAFTKPYATRQAPFELLQDAGAHLHTQSTTPRLQLDNGVISWLICEKGTIEDVDIGDHKLCTFVVKDVVVPTHAELDTAQALAYGQKAFRALGPRLEPSPLLAKNKSFTPSTSSLRAALGTSCRQSTVLSSSVQGLTRPGGPLLQASSFHSSCRRALASTAVNMARFRLAVWDTGTGTSHVLPSIPVNEDPTPVSNDVLRETVNDFLCHSQVRRAERLLKLRVAQKQVEGATTRLQAAMANGSLTIDECSRLEDTIGSNERFIARTLAHQAAFDLRDMLDRGHVSASRIQYIEKCIEKGQAALLHEAKDHAAGRPRTGFSRSYLKDKEAFEAQDQFLRVELMRLRDYYEDGDGD